MNRQGQPQRPPNLAPNPLANQFRSPYTYGLPPRNVNIVQGGGYVPGMPNNHRTPAQQTQTPMVPQPAQTFIQQRGQSNYGFNGGLGQHQTTNALQQQVNGTSNSLPLHLTPNPANAPSVSSTSEVGLDPNDFPALGSTSTNNNNGGGNNNGSGGSSVTTSYASQAGTGVGMGSGGSIGGTGSGATNQQRDFTPDDFPALGGQNQTQTNQEAGHSHPPGLNGFPQHSEHSQHRQNLLGTLSGGLQQSTPGMLNLGPAQARGVHPGFQHTEQEKQQQQQQQRNYNMKLNQPAHATWPSPNINPNSLAGAGFQNAPPTPAAQNGTHPIQNPSSSHVNAPPGVPPPSANPNASSTVSATPGFPSNGLDNPSGNPSSTNPNPNNANTISNNNPQAAPPNSTQNPNSMPSSTAHVHQHPQTPAQQVLMSAADRWGLLGLLAMIKSAGSDVDQGLSSIGQDLGTMGLDMGYAGNLFSTFITPWADQSAAHTVEPDYHIPTCYNVPSSVPGPSKAQAFSDETLFFMFYSSPRDALQEVAAQELWNRNWRFHKELRLWITKDSGAPPSQKIPMGETGQYTYWDPENWMKERKDMTVLYSDLEEKNVPVFSGAGLVPTAQQQGQTVVPPQQAQPAVQTPRGSFQMVV